MVRRYEHSGMPLQRIDPTSVMYGTTGTIYYRKTAAWKSGLLLMLSRGGWINTIHGNLELIDNVKGPWMAKAFSMYLPMEALGRTKTFGGIPGDVQPYGFASLDSSGTLYTVVNPAQEMREIELPRLSRQQPALAHGRILFRDAGFHTELLGNSITLGPEQMAVIGFGKYSSPQYDLGIGDDVVIPQSIAPIAAAFHSTGRNTVEASISPPPGGTLRIVMQQRSSAGDIARTWAGGPPKGENMGKMFTIEVRQHGRSIPVRINYDKVIWSGLSWAVGEAQHFAPDEPLVIRCTSNDKEPMKLAVRLYRVRYR